MSQVEDYDDGLDQEEMARHRKSRAEKALHSVRPVLGQVTALREKAQERLARIVAMQAALQQRVDDGDSADGAAIKACVKDAATLCSTIVTDGREFMAGVEAILKDVGPEEDEKEEGEVPPPAAAETVEQATGC